MHKRAGTRFNCRGVDDNGFVGNFVEKEQLITVPGKVLISHVQIGGTIPLFWQQFGVKEDVNITRPPELTKDAFHLHMRDLIKSYEEVYVLNLLKSFSDKEIKLTSGFSRQIYDADSDMKDKI